MMVKICISEPTTERQATCNCMNAIPAPTKTMCILEQRSVQSQLSSQRIVNLYWIALCLEIKEGFSVSEVFDALLLHQLFRFIPFLTKTSLDPAEPRTLARLFLTIPQPVQPGPSLLKCETWICFDLLHAFCRFQFDRAWGRIKQAVEAKCLLPIQFVCKIKSFGSSSISHFNDEMLQIKISRVKKMFSSKAFFPHTDSTACEVRRKKNMLDSC